MMRRIVLLVTVVAMMVAMLAISVAPAFAGHLFRNAGHGATYTCYAYPGYWIYGATPQYKTYVEKQGFECTRDR